MKHYKLIASDLDGTLLNNAGAVSRENLDAISKLYEQGVTFAPCTGRTYSEIPQEILHIPTNRYMIYSNGAVVYDRKNNARLFSRCIANDVVRFMAELFFSCETHITFRQNGQCFVDARYTDEKSFAYYHVIKPHQHVVREFAVYLDDFENTLFAADEVEVFSVFFRNYEDKIRCRTLLEQTQKLKTVEASEFNLEIMHTEAGKGNALWSLASALGITQEETIGVGDSDNDSSLVSAAGLGLAMSNSCESLKTIADETICSNEEHVVEYIRKHYI